MNDRLQRRGESRRPSSPWWEEILRGTRHGIVAASIRRFAQIGSWGYAAGLKGRDLAYARGWFAVKRLAQPTICVGNITVGGTGKTPLVIRLATDLMAVGLRPAVLLRGYKRETVRRDPVLVRTAKQIRAAVAEAGDEAMELALRLPGTCVGVGADRYGVGNFLLETNRIDCFILDDGFQHHRLARDINIVTVDVTDPWGGGKLLPAGLLREPPQALKRADAVVLTRAGSVGPDRLSLVREEVSTQMRPVAALLESRHEARELVSLQGHRSLSPAELRGRKILAISGIGNPNAFESTLRHLGAEVVGSLRLTDHTGRADEVKAWIAKNRREAAWALMTEKDAMRWGFQGLASKHALLNAHGIPVEAYALRMDLRFSRGEDHWRRLVTLVEKMVHAR